ncbi:hypothetical protein V5O48_008275 [Marasmius crinis-equi]|uniref:Uncharacterized protein n=1 Tax=Marasmius crinis-equi TaxID=585013 RepID=A0ABR3FEE1_9AGAR
MSFNASAGLPLVCTPECSLSTPMPPRLHQNLISIIRRANDFYRMVAAVHRASRKPTYHARKLASKIGLRVDTWKAKRCPMRSISMQAYPLVDTTLGPDTPPARSVVQDLYEAESNIAPVIPYDIPGVCRATVSQRSKARKVPPIVIPAIGSERRPATIAPHERIADIHTSPTQPSSYFSAITPDDRETPAFDINVWDFNMVLQCTEQVVPQDIATDDSETDMSEVLLTPMSATAEDGSNGEDEDDAFDRFRSLAGDYPESSSDSSPSSNSSVSRTMSPSSLSSLSTPSDGSPMAVCNKRKLDYIDEDELSGDFRRDRKPPKYLRKEIQMAHPIPRYF